MAVTPGTEGTSATSVPGFLMRNVAGIRLKWYGRKGLSSEVGVCGLAEIRKRRDLHLTERRRDR